MEIRYCEKCGNAVVLDEPDQENDAPGHYVCFRCRPGGKRSAPAPKSKAAPPRKAEALNLFSDETVAVRRKQMKAPAAARPGPARAPAARGPASPKTPGGSRGQAPSGARLRFRCPHCRSTLQVQPVKKLSRMVCAKCKSKLFIKPAGSVEKIPQKGGVKKATGQRPGGPQRKPSVLELGLRNTARRERGEEPVYHPEVVPVTPLERETAVPRAMESAGAAQARNAMDDTDVVPPSTLPPWPASEALDVAEKPPTAGSPAATFLRPRKRATPPAKKRRAAVPEAPADSADLPDPDGEQST